MRNVHRSLYIFAVALGLSLTCAERALACGEEPVSIHCGSTPSTVIADTGELLSVFVANDHVYFTRADRDTLAFAPPVRVTQEAARIDHNGESRPKIALGRDGAIFVSWTRRLEAHFSGDVYFSRSLDGGSTFDAPRVLRDTPVPSSHRFDVLEVTRSGRLYAAWIDKRDFEAEAGSDHDSAGASIYYAYSDDQGASFSPNRRAAAHSCECCRLAALPAGDDGIRLLWRHVFDGSIRDHALIEIAPDGPSQLQRVSNEDWELLGCPHAGPHMAAAGTEGVHMAWFTGAPGAGGVHYGYRDFSTGNTVRLKHIDARPGAGKPQVAVWEDRVDLFWIAAGAEQSDLLHKQSLDAGRSWSPPQTLATSAGAVDHPQLLQERDALWVAWHTRNEGYQLLSLATSTSERQ